MFQRFNDGRLGLSQLRVAAVNNNAEQCRGRYACTALDVWMCSYAQVLLITPPCEPLEHLPFAPTYILHAGLG